MPAIDTSVPVGRGAHMTLGGTAFVGAMAASPDVVNRLATVTNEFKGMPAIDTSVPVGGSTYDPGRDCFHGCNGCVTRWD